MHPGYILVLSLCVCCGQINQKEENRPSVETSSTAVRNSVDIGVEKIDSLFIHKFLLQYPQYRPYRDQLYSFYKNRNYTLAWTNAGEPIPQASLLINLIENMRQYGIPTDSSINYNIRDSLTVIVEANKKSSETIEKLRKSVDLALTSLYFGYAPKLWEGVIDPHRDEGIEWYIQRKEFSYTEVLDSILNDTENKNPFIDNRGFHSQYFKLKKALKRYSEIEKHNQWREIKLGNTLLSKGDSAEAVRAVAERLFQLGDLSKKPDANRFTEQIRKAVAEFQRRHGLNSDGIIGPKTVQALNISPQLKLKQIILNMERWRWVPAGMEGNYVYVNIPEFRLYLVEDDRVIQTMKVIVGKSGSHTVVFNDQIKYLVVNPYWNIPRSIATEEILPEIKKDASYLTKKRIEVGIKWNFDKVKADTIDWQKVSAENFRYTLRKQPGPDNPLGRVKFIFPNDFAIYLHDTPATELFDERQRGFSHGCIRVEKPFQFAEYLIKRNERYTFEDVKQLLRERENKWIELETPLPVYILYFTVWVDEAGDVHFRDDLYGHDAHLADRLFQNQ